MHIIYLFFYNAKKELPGWVKQGRINNRPRQFLLTT